MSYRNNRFSNSMHSLDTKLGNRDLSKVAYFSDRGAGVERMIALIDSGEDSEAANRQLPGVDCPTCASCSLCSECTLARTILHLVARGTGYLAPTLVAIATNRGDREATIASLCENPAEYGATRRRYFRHREELLWLFTNPSAA